MTDRPGKPAPGFPELRGVALHPAHNGRMRHRQAALGHHLHQVTQTDLEPEIPPNAQDDDFAVEVATLEQLLHDLQLAHCRPQLVQHTNLADPTAPFAPEPSLEPGYQPVRNRGVRADIRHIASLPNPSRPSKFT